MNKVNKTNMIYMKTRTFTDVVYFIYIFLYSNASITLKKHVIYGDLASKFNVNTKLDLIVITYVLLSPSKMPLL